MDTYTVNISLPKPLADLAKEQVRRGYYSSVSEVVRDALRNLFVDAPVYKMSAKAEKKAQKAVSEYKSGKIKPLETLGDLE